MNRRELVTMFSGAAAAWPLAPCAQQAMPVIGFLRSSTEAGFGHLVAAFRQGLGDFGFVEGQNIKIEFRWGESRAQLSTLAIELVRRNVNVIVCNYGSMLAVMAATKTVPVVFVSGEDPV